MNGADPSRWSSVAAGWAELWGGFAEPAWRAVLDVAGARSGVRVLDVGCGSGDFLAYCGRLGMVTAGIDPAPGMVELARRGTTDVRLGGAEKLPWSDASFDLTTSFNALQFAEDTDDALAEMIRVTVPGGYVAVANWAEASRNDLDAVERALDDGPPRPDGDLRVPGGLEELLTDGGLVDVVEALAEVPWHASDDKTLLRGVLLGEHEDTDRAAALLREDADRAAALGEDADRAAALGEYADRAAAVLAAARPYRKIGGGYRLVNHFRYAVGRRAAGCG
ncbi:methyltransferase domain-containing protein [Actinoplanes sp. NPDC051346]|uniref:class I SAM-dependent methyltransferase n=1 Tax=Actinoplanes sp. NPDC051346 TaxID=3155048 RepID=UPI00343128FF